jgi:hypothetical protein
MVVASIRTSRARNHGPKRRMPRHSALRTPHSALS